MSALGSIRAATAKASVNLRGDLAKLSDAELAERLEAAWRSRSLTSASPCPGPSSTSRGVCTALFRSVNPG